MPDISKEAVATALTAMRAIKWVPGFERKIRVGPPKRVLLWADLIEALANERGRLDGNRQALEATVSDLSAQLDEARAELAKTEAERRRSQANCDTWRSMLGKERDSALREVADRLRIMGDMGGHAIVAAMIGDD